MQTELTAERELESIVFCRMFSSKCGICSSYGEKTGSMTSPPLWLNGFVARQGAKLPTFQHHVSFDFVKPNFVLIIKSKA